MDGDNPYRPPENPSDDHPGGRRRSWARTIPAFLCLVFGGLGIVGFLMWTAQAIRLTQSPNPPRIPLQWWAGDALLLVSSALIIVSAWVWAKSRWWVALPMTIVSYFIGVAGNFIMTYSR
jgi:hypothetical protein